MLAAILAQALLNVSGIFCIFQIDASKTE